MFHILLILMSISVGNVMLEVEHYININPETFVISFLYYIEKRARWRVPTFLEHTV